MSKTLKNPHFIKKRMKILAFSDTHLHKKALDLIKENAKNVDFLICAGDISWFSHGLKEVLKDLDTKITKPIYIIPGNHEEGSNLEEICKNLKHIIYMHKKAKKIGDYIFFFWGAGGFAEINKPLESAMGKFKEKIKKEDKIIFITHGPPYNTELDFLDWAGHVGCKSQRKFIQEIRPILHICGHLHENFHKKQLINKTLILNPGPEGTIVEL